MQRRKILLGWFVLAMLVPAWAEAQAPLQLPAPLVAESKDRTSPGEDSLTLLAAQRAVEMGFPSAAVELYRKLLDEPGSDRPTLVLGLATSLLDEGRAQEAGQALKTVITPRGSAWHLRAGLSSAEQKDWSTARTELSAINPNDLTQSDRSWWLFLQGMVAESDTEHEKSRDRAREFYSQASDTAVSAQARARFLLKRDQALVRVQPPNDAHLDATRRNMEQFQGRPVGYSMARTYAVMLDSLGRKNEAVTVLQRQLLSVSGEERNEVDETRLYLGLIAGAEEGPGRNALERLLERAEDRDKQRIALQLLARSSTKNPQLESFRKLLDELIGAPKPHPILEDLLLFRAQAALASKTSEGFVRAEEDARTLLQKFPGSPLKVHAYGVLTAAAWEQLRYRTAADNAVKARGELRAGQERASLGVLVAEAWFRARDFRNAADAYAAALREPPTGITPGELMFQRVLSEIEAGAPDAAAQVLDELARNKDFDAISRWQGEWNVARALQARGRTADAYARVNKLLDSTNGAAATSLPPELRARMVWLQARLSAVADKPEETIRLVDGLGAALSNVSAELKTEIASSGELLRAQANFALGREQPALDILNKVRADYPRSDAAVYSYFEEAEHYANQDKTVEAQQLLTKLADNFPNHAYAPLALFQAALQAERRGQSTNLEEANRLIEDLVGKYPNSQLVFAARLKQGDLLRKLNQFPQAQRAYEDLVNKNGQRPDIALAQLALAETHNAQAASEPAHAERAAVLFEDVLERVDAPLDARVEAGFNLGFLRARRGDTNKAQEVWWRDVVTKFLLDSKQAEQLGDKGRYWMTRTLLELGTLYEHEEKLEQAKEAWLLILRAKLGYGEALAKSRLARFNLPEAKS
jgi:TolA-binding protein